jgi:hypothetical protein
MKNRNKIQKPAQEQQKEFPGYPLYDPSEDIMNRGKRIEADVEDLDLLENKITSSQGLPSIKKEGNTINDDMESVAEFSDDSSVTADDMEALGSVDLSMDMGDDEQLRHRAMPVDFSGKDLDVPGAELDDLGEAIGSEDEENNAYSLGGDNHNDLEEGH